MTTRPPLPAPAQDLIGRRYSCRTYLDRPISAGRPGQAARLHGHARDRAVRLAGPLRAAGRGAGRPPDAPAPRHVRLHQGRHRLHRRRGAARAKRPRGLRLPPREIVLLATGLGLGTCWLGGTFTRSTFARRFGGRGATRRCRPSSLSGYIGDDGAGASASGRRAAGGCPPASCSSRRSGRAADAAASAGRYATALEAVRMAPSATNKQPWRIVRDGGDWHFYLQRTKGYGKGSPVFRAAHRRPAARRSGHRHVPLRPGRARVSG